MQRFLSWHTWFLFIFYVIFSPLLAPFYFKSRIFSASGTISSSDSNS